MEWPAVVTPAGRGTAGMRGSVRQGRWGRRLYALAVNSSGVKGANKIRCIMRKGIEGKKGSEIRYKIK